jgi:hypothetical protein
MRTTILTAKWDDEIKAYRLDTWTSKDGEWWVQLEGWAEWPEDVVIRLEGGPSDGEYAGY